MDGVYAAELKLFRSCFRAGGWAQQGKDGFMTHLATFPRGWFAVATSDQVTQSAPLRLSYFDRKFVAFRDSQGTPHVLDAFCPHMGADLSARGLIEGDGLRCPFHAWKFAGDGRCVDVPGTDQIPPKARVGSLPVREINGLIHIWHDEAGGAPDYELPDLEEYNDPTWSTWTFAVAEINTHPREIIDNIADKAHFGPVHASVPESFENHFDKHNAVQIMSFKRSWDTRIGDGGESHVAFDAFLELLKARGLVDNVEDLLMTSHATYHGPGYLLTDLHTLMKQRLLVCHTPISEMKTRVWTGAMLYLGEGDVDGDFEVAAKEFEKAAIYGVYQDIEIWENKEPCPNPMLSAADGAILRARKWYRQFYELRG